MLGLGHDLRFELVGLLQVAGDVHVGREEDHVLLAAAEGHLQELVQALDGLSQEAPRQGDVCPTGPFDGIEGHGRMEVVAVAVGDDAVADGLDLDTLGLHQKLLDDGVRGLGAARGDLEGVAAEIPGADHELGPADVAGVDGDGLHRFVQQIEPVGLLYLDEYLLRRLQVVEQRDLDGELLASNGGEGEVDGQEEGLEHAQRALSHAESVLLRHADGAEHPRRDAVGRFHRHYCGTVRAGLDILPDPRLREELAHPLHLGQVFRRSLYPHGRGGRGSRLGHSFYWHLFYDLFLYHDLVCGLRAQ